MSYDSPCDDKDATRLFSALFRFGKGVTWCGNRTGLPHLQSSGSASDLQEILIIPPLIPQFIRSHFGFDGRALEIIE